MSGQELGRDQIARNLQEAIDRLQDDITRIQFWASALGCFSRPVPDYKHSDDFILPRADPDNKTERRERLFR